MLELLDFILHAEAHLREFLANYGSWTYAILFLIIFCETGLVVTPFLPGDSLLFAVGALAAENFFDVHFTFLLLAIAAILGDTVNYWIGRWLGPKVFHYEKSRWFNPEHLARAHAFYEKHGGKAIILARFVPIVRTFAPFVAGVGTMHYAHFIFYNVIGALIWIGLFLYGGFLLGNLPGVKDNMKIIILLIIVVSILPIVYEWLKARRESTTE